jgi:hypothetical protein
MPPRRQTADAHFDLGARRTIPDRDAVINQPCVVAAGETLLPPIAEQAGSLGANECELDGDILERI